METGFFSFFYKEKYRNNNNIGIFLAVSKYFSGDGNNSNSVIVSYLATIFVIFLFIILFFDFFIYFIRGVQKEGQKQFPEMIVGLVPYIGMIFFMCFIFLIVLALADISFTHPIETNKIIVTVDMIAGILIGSLFSILIILKVKKTIHAGFIVFLDLLLILLFSIIFDVQHSTPNDLIYQPFSIKHFFLWLMPVFILTLLATIGKATYNERKMNTRP